MEQNGVFCENAIKKEPGGADGDTNIALDHLQLQSGKNLPKTEPRKVNWLNLELNTAKRSN